MPFKSLSEVWAHFDDKDVKKYDALDISAAIAPLQEGPEKVLCEYELLAFGFVPSNKNCGWGTYYGYQWSGTNNETGEEFFIPNITDLTPAIIAYWESRSQVVENPLLKMRYTGLVLDFKKKITGKSADYKKIKLANVEAIIEVVAGDFCKYQLVRLDYAARALKLAIGFNDDSLIHRVVKAFYEAHIQIAANDSSAGLWGHIFKALIKYRKAFAQYEVEIIQENLERLDRVEALAIANGSQTDSYVHTLGQQVDLLCEYYHSIGEDSKIEGLLDRLLAAMRLSIPLRGGMWGQGMFERMQQRYRKYGLDKKANQLYFEVGKLGEQTMREMKRVESSFQVKREDINRIFDYFVDGAVEEAIKKYIIHYIPIKEHEIKRQQEMAKEHPFLDMVSTINIDAMGNALNKIGVGKDAQEQKLHHSMLEGIMVSGFFMRLVMDRIKETKNLTVDTLLNMFENCPLVNEDRMAFLKCGFDAYLTGNDIACCHILVPQFEAMMRCLVSINGGEILRQAKNPNEGNEYSSLELLLESPASKSALTEDILEYFKVLFVSQAGWNIRNSLSHGLFRSSSYNRTMSDRVVHAILVLSQVRFQDDNYEVSDPSSSPGSHNGSN